MLPRPTCRRSAYDGICLRTAPHRVRCQGGGFLRWGVPLERLLRVRCTPGSFRLSTRPDHVHVLVLVLVHAIPPCSPCTSTCMDGCPIVVRRWRRAYASNHSDAGSDYERNCSG